ncbi:hypothetical protein SAMN06265827_12824 [Orenia metallireducens]|uniref:Uncharacterized protein n=1 Tax=Orenia metallireducens TaxID=1413210 RepID=A0A285HZV0_9FIRM|nr:hypothetical protein [Orenia metallireducens]SNY41250.1 hypothetical protein SAMN06265827_12824 [Orenia metallireducens]
MFKNFDRAKRIAGRADYKLSQAKKRYKEFENNVVNSSNELAKVKNKVYEQTIEKRFIPLYQKFKAIELKNIRNNDGNIPISEVEVKEFKQQSIEFKTAIEGILGAAGTGASAGLGALSLAGSVGVASTGTAISSLSGAAATNATLAWFGGGSLASGGLGMAGGMAILGGITLLPALAVGGFIINSKSEKALTEAKQYEKEAIIAIEKIKNGQAFFNALNFKIIEATNVILSLNNRLNFLLDKVEEIDNRLGNKEKYEDSYIEENDGKLIILTHKIAKCLKSILEIPIVNKDGGLNSQLEEVCNSSNILLNEGVI